METDYLGKKKGKVGIEVVDQNGSEHIVEVSLSGDIVFHGNDDYPHEPEDRTDEEQRIMTQVEKRARYEAQRQFPDEDILQPGLRPEVIQRALHATQHMPAEDFEEVFRPLYDAVGDPGPYLPDGIPASNTVFVSFGFPITDDDEFGIPGELHLLYVDADGDTDMVGDEPEYDPDDDHVVLYMPPVDYPEDFTHPDDFFTEVQANLVFQIRDIYEGMGEEPPEFAQVDGYRVYSVPGDDEGSIFEH